MRLDWYDRRILDYVLTCPSDTGPSNGEAMTRFGIDSNRLLRRFDAVVEAYTSNHLPLDEPDLRLVQRSASFRRVSGIGRELSRPTG